LKFLWLLCVPNRETAGDLATSSLDTTRGTEPVIAGADASQTAGEFKKKKKKKKHCETEQEKQEEGRKPVEDTNQGYD
jgi:hypothetical protein